MATVDSAIKQDTWDFLGMCSDGIIYNGFLVTAQAATWERRVRTRSVDESNKPRLRYSTFAQ